MFEFITQKYLYKSSVFRVKKIEIEKKLYIDFNIVTPKMTQTKSHDQMVYEVEITKQRLMLEFWKKVKAEWPKVKEKIINSNLETVEFKTHKAMASLILKRLGLNENDIDTYFTIDITASSYFKYCFRVNKAVFVKAFDRFIKQG